jgi:hypothetical protein
MRAICKQLVEGRVALDEVQGDALARRADQAQEYATRDEGFFRNILLLITQERKLRREAARDASDQAQEALRRVEALDQRLQRIAASRFGARVVTL